MQQVPDHITAQSRATGVMQHVLIVDDSRLQRRILRSFLERQGLTVAEAATGAEALELAGAQAFDLVLSDWMMPGMNGLEFCRAFREMSRESYAYFILLTSKSEKDEVALGLDAGADDFLTKPLHPDELRARITAGERILRIERELVEKARLVSETLTELQSLYDCLDRDLVEARKLQQSLVRERHRKLDGGEVSLLLRPSGHVGGDLVGFFPISDSRVALFSLDVSGHGVASALMTARLAGLLSGHTPEQNIALLSGADARSPAAICAHLNRLLCEEMETDQYLTLAYADVDLESGLCTMAQAGHPHPVWQRGLSSPQFLGQGGLPIGLLAQAEYESFSVTLQPGDRILLLSDGITECPDDAGAELGEDGLSRFLTENSHNGPALLDALVAHLVAHAGGAEFRDDVSGVLFEYHGRKAIAPPAS